MDRKTMNAIVKLRKLGATRIALGGIEVHFASESPSDKPIQIALEEALNEFHESIADAREVEDLEEKQAKILARNKLTYSHS